MSYSQNNEQEYILKFFEGTTGSLIDIGASDGIHNSNSRALIEEGWNAVLVEPHSFAFTSLIRNSLGSVLIEAAIGEHDGKATFYYSDDSQISTLNEEFTHQWKRGGSKYREVQVNCMTVQTLLNKVGFEFDFLTIDAEGSDFNILKQFSAFGFCGAKMICIECSGQERAEIRKYLDGKGLKFYHQTDQNLLMTR